MTGSIDPRRLTNLYRLFDKAGRLLYVGTSVAPQDRWEQHAREKLWWSSVARATVEWHSVNEVDALASAAHAGQVDKIGVPYIEHVRAVAAGLAPFGDELVMAGLLHDVIEDTDWTAEQLRGAGVPYYVIALVVAVTNERGIPYETKVARITGRGRDAVLLKIADNAHNSHPDRSAQLPEEKRTRLAAKYRAARDILWPAAEGRDIETIVRIVNPSLLDELRGRQSTGSPS